MEFFTDFTVKITGKSDYEKFKKLMDETGQLYVVINIDTLSLVNPTMVYDVAVLKPNDSSITITDLRNVTSYWIDKKKEHDETPEDAAKTEELVKEMNHALLHTLIANLNESWKNETFDIKTGWKIPFKSDDDEDDAEEDTDEKTEDEKVEEDLDNTLALAKQNRPVKDCEAQLKQYDTKEEEKSMEELIKADREKVADELNESLGVRIYHT